ncbi:proline--tRNA ligase [Desulfohalovibrio reitneri]|uniref:proline--tRNA ligase n=1 Tax=Desulfohalovibrio reitneri TaxID=1307759 RepID=UPI0004A778B7|nr:proline--tRNA ligase [Desulfohalovibrio reitneri]
MRFSRLYAPTLKEAPRDAEVVSHKLLSRAGYIRQLTSGIYTFLPLGLRALNNVADVVREEMNRAGAQELLLPMVQPGDLWKETGRWTLYGRELLRFTDRKDADFCLGPTHEEVITDLVRGEVRSYRQLPLNLYQIQTKFRDEIRPRFGLMRCREFVMKDAYSFDRDDEGAQESYQTMFDAYVRIFRRLGLRFKSVEADSGAIGGSHSHEFMVTAATGEDVVAACTACEYAANLEKAQAVCSLSQCDETCAEPERVETPGAHTVAEVARMMDVPPSKVVKTLLFEVDGASVAALVRGDRDLEEIKLKNALNAQDARMADADKVKAWSGAPVGFAGPVGLKVDRIVADVELCGDTGWVVGANEADAHLKNVDLPRDVGVTEWLDLRQVVEGDACPRCRTKMTLARGIEVGHVFKLGEKYSKAMEATYLDENGKEKLLVMGCYGIGVSRIVASAIEQNHDDAGIIFPPAIAPFEAAVISLGGKDPAVDEKAAELHDQLESLGIETLWDDRDERPGVKFKDADLMGMPFQLIVGGKGLARGVVEAKDRRTGEKSELPLDGFAEALHAYRREVWTGWGLSPDGELG